MPTIVSPLTPPLHDDEHELWLDEYVRALEGTDRLSTLAAADSHAACKAADRLVRALRLRTAPAEPSPVSVDPECFDPPVACEFRMPEQLRAYPELELREAPEEDTDAIARTMRDLTVAQIESAPEATADEQAQAVAWVRLRPRLYLLILPDGAVRQAEPANLSEKASQRHTMPWSVYQDKIRFDPDPTAQPVGFVVARAQDGKTACELARLCKRLRAVFT